MGVEGVGEGGEERENDKVWVCFGLPQNNSESTSPVWFGLVVSLL